MPDTQHFPTAKLAPAQAEFFEKLNAVLDILQVDTNTFDSKFQTKLRKTIGEATTGWYGEHSSSYTANRGQYIASGIIHLVDKTFKLISRAKKIELLPIELSRSATVNKNPQPPFGYSRKVVLRYFQAYGLTSRKIDDDEEAPQYNVLQTFATHKRSMKILGEEFSLPYRSDTLIRFDSPQLFLMPALTKTIEDLTDHKNITDEQGNQLRTLMNQLELLIPSCVGDSRLKVHRPQSQLPEHHPPIFRDKEPVAPVEPPFKLSPTRHREACKLDSYVRSHDWKKIRDKDNSKEMRMTEYLWQQELKPIITAAGSIVPTDLALNQSLERLFDDAIVKQAQQLNTTRPIATMKAEDTALAKLQPKLREIIEELSQSGHLTIINALGQASTLLVMTYGTPENCRKFRDLQSEILDTTAQYKSPAEWRARVDAPITNQEALLENIMVDSATSIVPVSPHRSQRQLVRAV